MKGTLKEVLFLFIITFFKKVLHYYVVNDIIYINRLCTRRKDMAQSGDFLRGHTETIILQLLTEADSYGYEISKNIIERSNGMIDIKDATIYTAFRRMENDGLLATYWGDGTGGARRRYYSITETGKKVYIEKKEQWLQLKAVLDKLILGGEYNV